MKISKLDELIAKFLAHSCSKNEKHRIYYVGHFLGNFWLPWPPNYSASTAHQKHYSSISLPLHTWKFSKMSENRKADWKNSRVFFFLPPFKCTHTHTPNTFASYTFYYPTRNICFCLAKGKSLSTRRKFFLINFSCATHRTCRRVFKDFWCIQKSSIIIFAVENLIFLSSWFPLTPL